jgi:chromosome segregation ATPase
LKDNEIIKTWQKIQEILKRTENVVLQKDAIDDLVRHITNALDLINRQKAENKSQSIMIKMLKGSIEDYKNSYINQKAEIERLKNDLAISKKETKRYMTSYKTAKAENKELKAKIDKLKLEMSYMSSPNTIGDRHEMGCW